MEGSAVLSPRKAKKAPKLSRLHKPAELSLESWQIELRRQFGRDQAFGIKNLGEQPIFSEYEVTNPESRNTYRVAIRGPQLGENYCSCPDFATNTLGTCKQIEFTLAQLERKRGGKTALAAGFQPAYSEVYLHYGARREVRFRPGAECPVELARLAARFFDSDGMLSAKGFGKFEDFLKNAGRFEHDLRCYDDVLALIAEVRDRAQRTEALAAAFPAGSRSKLFRDLLKVSLYDYQRDGALFAARAGRCLIGDEMGLGKTIQAIAAAEIMARLFGVERVLIVCPTSLKHQWEREIARFINRSVEVIAGMQPRRQELFKSPSFFKITNYDTVHRDLELIHGWSPDLVILDEAQRIKNWSTRAARSVKKIASPHAIVLTGTPLENRLEELVSIVQFIDQFRLGPTFRLLHEHQLRDEHGKVVGYRALDRIGATLEPILIRRQRDQVLKELPGRIDKHFFVPMTPQQLEHHEENREIVARIVMKWRRYKFLSEADQRRLMIALQNMRMACDSTYLLDQQTDHSVKPDELVTLLDEVFEDQGVKVVIFSQWLRMHELIVRRFQKRSWGHAPFHGGVPGTKRPALIDQFKQDAACRAFLATDAGGVGLNLQHASVVVNLDLPWNPAVLEQLAGRVHRLGQQRPVRVVNFVSQGTIEEGMLSLLKFKKSLFAGVLDGGEKEVFLGGSRLTRFMETVDQATSTISSVPAEEPADEPEAAEPTRQPAPTPLLPAAGPPAWAGLLDQGLALLQQLRAPASPGHNGLSIVRRDERTGESYLHLPMPKAQVLEQAMTAIGALVQLLRS